MADEQGHGARLTGASVSIMSVAEPTPGESPRSMSRFGPWIAAIWLFFLLDPIVAGWQDRNHVEGALGIVSTVAFGTVYLALWVRGRQDRARLIEHPPLRVSLVWLGVLIALGVAMVVLLGEPGIACSVYVAIAGVLVFPFRAAAPLSLSIAGIVLALGSLADWSSQIGTAFGVMAASVAIFGLRQVLARNLDLIKAHQENAQLAVESERSRFARDLHDILGHSLTVITVKAELAGRVLDSDPERARTELADLERLSRDALADVRRAVGGYREMSLSGELVRARDALRSAEIDAELPNSTDEVPGELRELFAWTVREGVTNVIRHSGASRCTVSIAPGAVRVEDDGRGPADATGTGHGLAGLRERAVAAGAVLLTSPAQPRGFRLEVTIP